MWSNGKVGVISWGWRGLIVLLLCLPACAPLVRSGDTDADISYQMTEIFVTAMAQVTQDAAAAQTAKETQQALAANAIPITASSTVESLASTDMPPTPVSTSSVAPSPTEASSPCNLAELVGDVTLSNGALVMWNEAFIKTWRIQNVGSCAWTGGYGLAHLDGNMMSGPDSISLNSFVRPGEVVDISLHLRGPKDLGFFSSSWMLMDDQGNSFGMGADGQQPLKVDIDIVPRKIWTRSTLTLDFIRDYCDMVWESSNDRPLCAAQGHVYGVGAVNRYLEGGILEGPSDENEPLLIMIPSEGADGFISGRYPPIEVKSGDYFQSWVGCMHDSPWCSLTLELAYTADGSPPQVLGSWEQYDDGAKDYAVVDLSSLAGRTVSFMLIVRNNGDSRDDRAFWLTPAIVH
jgi:hypothetical protein